MTAPVTIVGNTTADAELRYTQGGLAVASFTIASTEKVFDKATNEWKDGKRLFLRCTAWRELAEHVAGSIPKGTRVIATGKISTREFQTKEGDKRSSIELEVDEIGPSLRYATAAVARAQSQGRGQAPAAGGDEPWAPTPPAADSGVWATPGSYNDETPF